MIEAVYVDEELKILNNFCDIVLDKIGSKAKNIEKNDKEIYDENGEFLEIINPLFEELYAQQQLLIRCVYYELNSIRELHLYNIIIRYYSDENYIDEEQDNLDKVINKHQPLIDILAENNFNYDGSDVKNYWKKNTDNIDCNNLIELMNSANELIIKSKTS